MKLKQICLSLALVVATGPATLLAAGAETFAVPAALTGFVGPDREGSGYFDTQDLSLAGELFDLVGQVNPGNGAVFGFYFSGSPNDRYQIFGRTDQLPPVQLALIDFDVDGSSGAVLDLNAPDSAHPLESVFAINPNPIGFYLDIQGTVLYSDRFLNAEDQDVFADFALLSDPTTTVLGFIGTDQGNITLYLARLTEITPVPLPASLMLLPGALLLLIGRKRRAGGIDAG